MPFKNLKFLLAEDNEVNQLLGKGILRNWGVETTIAENGFEVLQLLAAADFDLVLMDIQMPGMSGIEASVAIRNLHDCTKKNIPIIALTANALKGEEKKYLAAGMDDYLTKPFNQADLHETIVNVLQQKGRFNVQNDEESAVSPQVQPKIAAEKLYDFKQLEELSAGDQSFIASLARIYLETIPATSAEMIEATKAGNWPTVSKLAHKLKSTVDTMNMVDIKTDIRTLELDARVKGNRESLCRIAHKVNDVINAVAMHIQQEYNFQ